MHGKIVGMKGNERQGIGGKVFRKPQSLIPEGHEKFSANRLSAGTCRVPCLRYLCTIKVDDDYTGDGK